MKVIEKGRPQKGWAREFWCTGAGNGDGGCGALLLVELGDLFQTTSCHMGEVDYFVTFKCPDCGVLTDIDRSPFCAASLPKQHEWKEARRPRQPG
jgi:predicted RNA-binding Zn-ribbon protein involved in translation (DUF1610 family)